MLKVGDQAPQFTLETDSGTKVTLSELVDKPVVIFFYPKDDTPGCTIECKEFRDASPKFAGKAHVFGISHDDCESHQRFRDKVRAEFPAALRSWWEGRLSVWRLERHFAVGGDEPAHHVRHRKGADRAGLRKCKTPRARRAGTRVTRISHEFVPRSHRERYVWSHRSAG